MAPIGTASDTEDLKRKCPGALADTELVNIVKRAPLNNNGKINLSWIDREAEKYLCEKLSSSQTIEKLRKETRVLAKFCRDREEEFEKLVTQKEQPEPEVKPIARTKKRFVELEFCLPYMARLITRRRVNGVNGDLTEDSIQFPDNTAPVINFCFQILRAILEDVDLTYEKEILQNGFIQLLEEKSGLKVKVCGNCKNYVDADGKHGEEPLANAGFCLSNKSHTRFGNSGNAFCYMDYWTPKEAPEKTVTTPKLKYRPHHLYAKSGPQGG